MHFQEDSMQDFKLQTLIGNVIQPPATQPTKFHPPKLWVQHLEFKKSRQSKNQFCFGIENKDKRKPYSSKQKLSSTKNAWVAGDLILQRINLFTSSQE